MPLPCETEQILRTSEQHYRLMQAHLAMPKLLAASEAERAQLKAFLKTLSQADCYGVLLGISTVEKIAMPEVLIALTGYTIKYYFWPESRYVNRAAFQRAQASFQTELWILKRYLHVVTQDPIDFMNGMSALIGRCVDDIMTSSKDESLPLKLLMLMLHSDMHDCYPPGDTEASGFIQHARGHLAAILNRHVTVIQVQEKRCSVSDASAQEIYLLAYMNQLALVDLFYRNIRNEDLTNADFHAIRMLLTWTRYSQPKSWRAYLESHFKPHAIESIQYRLQQSDFKRVTQSLRMPIYRTIMQSVKGEDRLIQIPKVLTLKPYLTLADWMCLMRTNKAHYQRLSDQRNQKLWSAHPGMQVNINALWTDEEKTEKKDEKKKAFYREVHRLLCAAERTATEAQTSQYLRSLLPNSLCLHMIIGDYEPLLRAKPANEQEEVFRKTLEETLHQVSQLRRVHFTQSPLVLRAHYSLYYLKTIVAILQIVDFNQADVSSDILNPKKIAALRYVSFNIAATCKLYENVVDDNLAQESQDTFFELARGPQMKLKRKMKVSTNLTIALLVGCLLSMFIPLSGHLELLILLCALVVYIISTIAMVYAAVWRTEIHDLDQRLMATHGESAQAVAPLSVIHDWQTTQYEIVKAAKTLRKRSAHHIHRQDAYHANQFGFFASPESSDTALLVEYSTEQVETQTTKKSIG